MTYKLSKFFFATGFTTITLMCFAQTPGQPLWKNNTFSLYADSVVQQNKLTGKALSSLELISNYKSPANEFLSPVINFKFSINGKDNEMQPGIDHRFTCLDGGTCETPLIKFGEHYTDNRVVPDNTFLKPLTTFKVKLDMRPVLAAFEKDGFYTTFKGDKIYKQDFKGVYVAGNTLPLIWDFDNLVNHAELKLQDDDHDGIYETSLTLNDQKNEKQTQAAWKLTKDIAAFPQYHSPYPISDALYNLATEEMINAVEPDSTFRTGKEWAGVWTRDISYSIILSMAYLQPKVAMNSLLRKVNKKGRIIQDTGTGGAWPASTDRIIWAVAAWEVYKATGDEDWLKKVYQIIKNSLEDDYKVDYDPLTGLVKGESSFLDWREQTYPKWMQPADIYESECLGTNAVHYQANVVLSTIAARLGDKPAAAKYSQVAAKIKAGINAYLWLPEQGYYAQFLYGRNSKIASQRSEALGEALTVLFGVAGEARQKQVIAKTPVMEFGVPCIYPQIPNIPPYHNNAVWPFVQTYFALAAAKAGNEEAVMESIAAIYRPAALWITNKENFVASNGDFAGTQINSSNMLWSLSGSLALIHKVIFGISLDPDGMSFHPFVPAALQGRRSLTNFKYRGAILDIEMEGYGNTISSFTLDGKTCASIIAATLRGRHTIKIRLADNKIPTGAINIVKHLISPDAPVVTFTGNNLSWNTIEGAKGYKVLKNGKDVAKKAETTLAVAAGSYAEYQVITVDANGTESFASEPVAIFNKAISKYYELEADAQKSDLPYKGFTGNGFVEMSKTKNTSLTIPVNIAAAGVYVIDFRYANGNGPVNTENKCAIRTLSNCGKTLGTVILPQRGKEEWSNWGWTNSIQATFTKGSHILTLSLQPQNENMNGEINQAMLDYLRIIRIR